MSKKPANLIYGLDDRPPLLTSTILGFQHIMMMFIAIIFPVIIVRELGDAITARTAQGFISLTMISGGVVTILQAIKKDPLDLAFLVLPLQDPHI